MPDHRLDGAHRDAVRPRAQCAFEGAGLDEIIVRQPIAMRIDMVNVLRCKSTSRKGASDGISKSSLCCVGSRAVATLVAMGMSEDFRVRDRTSRSRVT
jgi:hypothetical protein